MRWEWGDVVRYHRWDIFERLAKDDPSQQLCDTVAELAQGLTEKPDRKALKKVLYLLKLKGFEPREPEPTAPEPPKLPKIGTYGVMHGPNAHGWRTYFYGQVLSGEIWGLLVSTLEEYGVIDIRMIRVNAKAWPVMRKDLIEDERLGLRAEIDPAYALHRIRNAYENRNVGMDKTSRVRLSSYWKQHLQRVPIDFEHPAARHTIAVGVTPELRLMAMREHPDINHFRIFLPPDDPVWTEIHSIRWDEEFTQEERVARYLKILKAERVRLCTEFVIEDMVQRFLDVVFLLNDPQSKELWVIMHLAEHLQKEGYRSEVFEGLLESTARDLEEDIEEDEDDPALIPRQRDAAALVGADEEEEEEEEEDRSAPVE